MNTERLMIERGRLILEDAQRMGKPASLHHYDTIACRFFADITPEDRRAAVNEALRQANAQEHIDVPVIRRSTGEAVPGGAPPDSASTSSEPEFMTRSALKDITRAKLQADPNISAGDLWHEITRLGKPKPSKASWATSYYYPIRQELGFARPTARKPGAGTPLKERATAPEPVRAAPAPQAAPEAPEASRVAPEPVEAPAAAQAPGARPAYIELGDGDELLKATRGEDGSWDLEFKAKVDAPQMDSFARMFIERMFAFPVAAGPTAPTLVQ